MTNKQQIVFIVMGVMGIVVVAACGGNDSPPPNNGVDDVKQACEIRTQWTKLDDQTCIDCLSVSKAPQCGCPAFQQEYVAKCNAQSNDVGAEHTCDFVGDCTGKCARNDCACVDACYNDRPNCRPKAAALDGCTTDVCDKYCR
jgi:hypothetical protein